MAKYGWATRLIFMVGALIGIIYAKNNIGREPSGFVQTLLAPPQVASTNEGGQSTQVIQWCGPQLQTLQVHNGPEFEKVNDKWQGVGKGVSSKSPATAQAVEFWLKRNCHLAVDSQVEDQDKVLGEPEPLIVTKFADGTSAAIQLYEGGLFKYQDMVFKSDQLANALHELDLIGKGAIKIGRANNN